jgi:xanthine dehydrogenase accessory factor
MFNETIVVRGGGDIATGTIHKLHRSGFKVVVLDIEKPTAIRRSVCFSEAIYEGEFIVEGIKAVRANNINEIKKALAENKIPVVIDPKGNYINIIKPEIIVDAILAKRNLGTNMSMADITIALGPGFQAGKDVNVVIETMRGHNLGRVIFKGEAQKNTGVPGDIMGYTKERVIYSSSDGIIKSVKEIGDLIKQDEIIAYVNNAPIRATMNGILRGLIRDGSKVTQGLKIADIDPRLKEKNNCNTISDKARNIAGGVLEAILYLKFQKQQLLLENKLYGLQQQVI